MEINFKYFSGHEGFSLREGWLRKGLLAVAENPKVFTKAELIYAIDSLGVGANMVKAIRYWLELFSLIEKENKTHSYKLSEVAKLLIEKDSYFQHKNTMWLLHVLSTQKALHKKGHVSTNSCIWQIVFSDGELNTFSLEKLNGKVISSLKENGKVYSPSTIKSAVNTFFKTYQTDKVDVNPEQNMISPLAKLGLISKYDAKTYRFRSIKHTEYSPYLIYLILFKKEDAPPMIQIEDAFDIIRKSIKIDMKNLRLSIEQLVIEKVVTIDRAAGLNNIRITKKLTTNEILTKIMNGDCNV